jgi:hypothetical protein
MVINNSTVVNYQNNYHTHTIIVIDTGYCKRCGSHNTLLTHCMVLNLEGLKVTQVESKHVALKM